MPENRTRLIIATCIVLIQPIILQMIDPWTILFIAALLNSNEFAVNRALFFIVTCSQTPLISGWVALSPMRSYFQFPLAILGISWPWWVQTRGGLAFSEKQAIQLTVQAIIIVFCISLMRIVGRFLRLRGCVCKGCESAGCKSLPKLVRIS